MVPKTSCMQSIANYTVVASHTSEQGVIDYTVTGNFVKEPQISQVIEGGGKGGLVSRFN